jgi:hypothetical protein
MVPVAALVAALLLVASQVALVWLSPGYAGPHPTEVVRVLPLILLLVLPGALALIVVARLSERPARRGVMSVMLLCGLAMRLVWLGNPAPLEDDYHRYLWDGAVVAHGLDPYRLSPEAVMKAPELPQTLTRLRTTGQATLSRINFPDLTSIYPGVAELIFAFAHVLAPWSLDALRIIMIAGDMATAAALMSLLHKTGRSPLLANLYWVNPLVVFVSVATAHVDALLAPTLLGATLMLATSRPVPAAVLLGLAVGIKIWPLLLVPLVFVAVSRSRNRTETAKATIVFVSIVGVSLAPVLAAVSSPVSGLAAYAHGWSNNNALFAWASFGADELFPDEWDSGLILRLAIAGIVGAIALRSAVRPLGSLDDLLRRQMTISAILFYSAPAQFPWYALWFLPFAAAVACYPLLLASVTLATYYFFFPLWESGQGETFQYWVSFAHSLPVWAWLGWEQRATFVYHARAWLDRGNAKRHV